MTLLYSNPTSRDKRRVRHVFTFNCVSPADETEIGANVPIYRPECANLKEAALVLEGLDLVNDGSSNTKSIEAEDSDV